MSGHGRQIALAAILALALGLAGGASALADFPYSPAAHTNLHDFSTFHTDPGQFPNNFGDDWKLAATPENSQASATSDNWKPTELCGVRGASVTDINVTFPVSDFQGGPPSSCTALAGQPVHTGWDSTTGRPDVAIAETDSGIEWNDHTAMVDLRKKVRLNTGELPYPEVSQTATDPSLGVNCGAINAALHGGTPGTTVSAHSFDVNGDDIVNLADYACDPRLSLTNPERHGPAGMMTPEDLIIAFGNCQLNQSTHLVTSCTPGQHYDNDHNGFANDIAGWDFVDNKNNPFDDVQYGHGTGEMEDSTGEANNGPGTDVGTCANCMILPLRVGESFIADGARFAQAVLYATDSTRPAGCNVPGCPSVYVIQEPLGTINNSSLDRQAVEYAYQHGVAIIASAADEAAEHHNQPSALADMIDVNSANQYDTVFTPSPRSYLQFNGCTNFTTHLIVSVPSSSCSSEATGKASGITGLIYSAALNAIHAGTIQPNQDCRRVDGSRCPLTANEVRQLIGSGNVHGSAPADQGSGQANDVNFAQQPEPACNPVPTPACTDPNNNMAFDTAEQNGGKVVSALAESHRYPARKGFDEFYGYGRINAYNGVSAVAAGRVPPEAEITSPDWFFQLDPAASKIEIDGRVDARPPAHYTCVVEVAPGAAPNNARASDTPPGDFHPVASNYCDGSTAHSAAFSGALGQIDVATLKSYFPPTNVGSFNGREPGLAGAQTSNGRPNTMPYAFTVRVVVTTTGANPMTGEDRRQLFLHRDADTLGTINPNSHAHAWPMNLHTDGESTPVLVDLDGDNRNELVVATSDGIVHAFRPDGTELAGWPVHTDQMPVHTGELAFAGGPISPHQYAPVIGSLAAGDLFHDGRIEVVAADTMGGVYAWDSGGHLIFRQHSNPAFSGSPIYPGSNPLTEYSGGRSGGRQRIEPGFATAPVLAHLDGNPRGRLDIILAGEDRHLYAWQPQPGNVAGTTVPGFPVLVVDPHDVASVNPTTNEVTFNTATAGPDEGRGTTQGKLVDTPAVADISGTGKPEIIVGSNEEYDPGKGDEPAFNAGNFNSAQLSFLGQTGILGFGNSRIYAIKPTGLPSSDHNLAHAFLPGWPFKVGVIDRGLLPDVGEGITGSPVIGPVSCPSGPRSGSMTPHVGLIPDAGPGYILNADGTSCYGNDPSNGKPIVLQSDFSASPQRYDTPVIPAVGDPSFGSLAGQVTFVAPAAGAVRAADLLANEYQGGQDFLAAWNPSTGQLMPGWPSPVNDLQFLTGPAVGAIDQTNANESAVEGTASLDLAALGPTGVATGPNWPKLTGDWTIASPVLGSFGSLDTDASATKDIVSLTRSGLFTVYSTPASACSPSSWPRFHHDIANSGDYNRVAIPPGKPMNVSFARGTLTFTAPGAQLMCGTADHYEVVTSDNPITPENFSSAIPVAGAPAPTAAGTQQSMVLPAGIRRYVAIRADQAPSIEASNVGLPATIDTQPTSTTGGGTGAGGGAGGLSPPLATPLGPGGAIGTGGVAGTSTSGTTSGTNAAKKKPAKGRCASRRRLIIPLHAPQGETLRSARVLVNGRRVRTLHGRHLRAHVDLRGLPKGTFTVKIIARTNTGQTVRIRHRYHTCVPGRHRRRVRRRHR